jgi:archaellum biogenesis ATPase FlaH
VSDNLRTSHEANLARACLFDERLLADSRLQLAEYRWLDDCAAVLWRSLLDMADAGEPMLDNRILAERLKAACKRGGLATPERCIELIATADGRLSSHGRFYLAELAAAAEADRLHRVGLMLQDEGLPLDERKRLLKALATDHATAEPQQTESLAERFLVVVSRPAESAIETGLKAVDAAIGGFYPKQFCVLAARPSVGKSSLMLQLAMHAAKTHKVLFVSTEMSEQEYFERLLCASSGKSFLQVRRRNVDHHEVEVCYRRLQDRRLHFLETTKMSRIETEISRQRPDLVLIDQFTSLSRSDGKRPQWEQAAEHSAQLKQIARDFGCAVLAASQLNRDAEGRPPTLGQLRSTGNLEQDADTVLILHRDDRDDADAVLKIAKCRHGVTGSIDLWFDGKLFRFREATAEAWQP